MKSFIESSAFHRHFSSFHFTDWKTFRATGASARHKTTECITTNMQLAKISKIWIVKFLSQVAIYIFFSLCVIFATLWNIHEHRKLYLHIENIFSLVSATWREREKICIRCVCVVLSKQRSIELRFKQYPHHTDSNSTASNAQKMHDGNAKYQWECCGKTIGISCSNDLYCLWHIQVTQCNDKRAEKKKKMYLCVCVSPFMHQWLFKSGLFGSKKQWSYCFIIASLQLVC